MTDREIIPVICGEHSYFDDDIKGTCSVCGRTIYYRPYNENVGPKICLNCVETILGIHGKMVENLQSMKCPRCGKEGFPSTSGNVCTNCANELRRPENIEQAKKDGWLLKEATPIKHGL